MGEAARAVLARALELGPDERAELAAEVLASLDGPTDRDAEIAWKVEVERRVAALDAGTAKTESWDAVKRRIEDDLRRR